jgi:cobalt/nickel transport system permease protein
MAAMHISEGILPLGHAAAWGAAAAPFLALGVREARRLRAAGPSPRLALLGMSFAFTFAASAFPLPVPVVGASSHLCATPLVALILGPRLAVLPAAAALLAQALLLGHGGLTPIGANLLTMGIVAPWITVAVARAATAARLPRGAVVGLACAAGSAAVYAADAAILALALPGSQGFLHWFARIGLGFAPIQAPLLVVEALLGATIWRALLRRRPEALPTWGRAITATAVVLALLGGGVAAAEDYRGVDDLVMGAAAEEAGRPGTGPVLPVAQGDLPLFFFSAGGLVAGFSLGRGWDRLGRPAP